MRTSLLFSSVSLSVVYGSARDSHLSVISQVDENTAGVVNSTKANNVIIMAYQSE